MLFKIDGYIMNAKDQDTLNTELIDFFNSKGYYFIGMIKEDTEEEYNDEQIIDDTNSINYLMALAKQYEDTNKELYNECWDKINKIINKQEY